MASSVGQLFVIGAFHLTITFLELQSSPMDSESDSEWSLIHTEPSSSPTPTLTQSQAPTRASTPSLNSEPTPRLAPRMDAPQVLRRWRRFALRKIIGRHWSNLGNFLKEAKRSASRIGA